MTGADPKELLFVNSKGRPLTNSSWRRSVWLPAVKAARLEGLKLQDLRSVNASIMVAQGIDAKTAQDRLGHAQIGTTMNLYARSTPQRNRQASEKIHAVLRRSRISTETPIRDENRG